ncbi:MAG: ribonuclease E/G, partial [Bacteroidia bacterium]|nr:ribonuclease E/G [Bacteroidia bacterium]
MESELIINTKNNQVSIALLEEKRLVELNSEPKDKSFNVGDVYLGRVRKLMPGLNAAFVDIGHDKDAFLHYLDLGPQLQSLVKYTRNVSTGKQTESSLNNFKLEPDINKNGKINQVLKPKQWVVVQIAKEPISTKGPRLSSELSIAGRFVVLVPFSDTVSVSQKIKGAEERNRLKRLAISIKPKNFGVILRTVATGKKVAEIDRDIQDLVKKWDALFTQIKTAKPPHRLLGELDRTSTILRDMLNPNFNNIHINDETLADDIKGFIRNISPEQEKIVKLYRGKKPIFEAYSVDKQIKSLFGKTVNMPGGSYLVIEHTEAMHVVDVNSGGRKSNQNLSQEEQALKVNMNAAREIARQLRLRD